MRAPVRPIRGRWPAALEKRLARFMWADPRAILDAAATPEAFSTAMSALHIGETIKITGHDRHPDADLLLVENVDLTGATIVDMGASDGSTSVGLISKLPDFGAFVIADLHLTISTTDLCGHVLFFDQDGTCILIAGRRIVAWPSLSSAVRRLYRPLVAAARRRPRREVLLLNPAARAMIASDSRVTHAVHDVFQPWSGPPVDVIKVANLLRRFYFGDERISAALGALHDGLADGGHLLIVDNPRIDGIVARSGLYQRKADRFVLVAQTEHAPEIHDLVTEVRREDHRGNHGMPTRALPR